MKGCLPALGYMSPGLSQSREYPHESSHHSRKKSSVSQIDSAHHVLFQSFRFHAQVYVVTASLDHSSYPNPNPRFNTTNSTGDSTVAQHTLITSKMIDEIALRTLYCGIVEMPGYVVVWFYNVLLHSGRILLLCTTNTYIIHIDQGSCPAHLGRRKG